MTEEAYSGLEAWRVTWCDALIFGYWVGGLEGREGSCGCGQMTLGVSRGRFSGRARDAVVG